MTPTALHRWARPLVLEGLESAQIDPEPLLLVQAVQGVGFRETTYNKGWKGAGVGSNNMGAIQSGHVPCDPATSFEYRDTHPNPDGTSTSYAVCFRKYLTPESGFFDLVRQVYVKRPKVLAAARSGHLPDFSREMHASRYYEGTGRTVAERIARHYRWIHSAVSEIAEALDEPAPALEAVTFEPWHHDLAERHPLLRRGSRLRSQVRALQTELNQEIEHGRLAGDVLALDGMFGPLTEHLVAAFQAAQGLKIDGIAGDATWGKLTELR